MREITGWEGASGKWEHPYFNPLLSTLQVVSQLQREPEGSTHQVSAPGRCQQRRPNKRGGELNLGYFFSETDCSSRPQVIPGNPSNQQGFCCSYWRLITMSLQSMHVGRESSEWVFCSSMGGYSLTVYILLEVTVMVISLGDKCFFKIAHM